jgi:hypothetical protein
VRDAIATFERSLATPNSRFDRFLRGDAKALGETERAGYKLFKQIGCTSCHQGVNIGGNSYQRLGVMEDYFAVRGKITGADLGRFNITRREEDRYLFKVPSLRNVALTAPYLHDGSAQTLHDVVAIMARYQLALTARRGRHRQDRRLPAQPDRRIPGEAARMRSFRGRHADLYRIAAAIAAAAALVALFVLTQPVDLARHNALLSALGQLQQDEIRLGEEVLKLRFQLLNNYDQVTAIASRLRDTSRELRDGDVAVRPASGS